MANQMENLYAIPPHPLSFSLVEKETAIDDLVKLWVARLLTAHSGIKIFKNVIKAGLMGRLPMSRLVVILSAPGLIQGFMELTQRRKGAKTQRKKSEKAS